jgi:hypothetical protein
MSELKREFMIGFREGWSLFWSPFTGFGRTFACQWRAHVSEPLRKGQAVKQSD